MGAALAFGLQRRGLSTLMLDEGDMAFRAARGNFGLVWVQGKGTDFLCCKKLIQIISLLV